MKKKRKFLSILLLGLFLACSSDDGPGTSGNPDDSIDKSGNLLATGSSANDLLSNTNFDALLIEIAHVAGFRPTDEAMTNFVDFLRERTFKENIQIIYNELPSPNEESLTLQEVVELENENRTAFNQDNVLAIYIYFADAPADTDDDEEGLFSLGAVYRNTSMIIYEQTIRNLVGNSALVTLSDVENATLNHEFGHLFGLVNLGTPMVNDHEDPDAENHCVVNGCLMRAELEFGLAMKKAMESNVSKGLAAIPELDAECLLDLQNNGGR